MYIVTFFFDEQCRRNPERLSLSLSLSLSVNRPGKGPEEGKKEKSEDPSSSSEPITKEKAYSMASIANSISSPRTQITEPKK